MKLRIEENDPKAFWQNMLLLWDNPECPPPDLDAGDINYGPEG
jgi:hypothetical protein